MGVTPKITVLTAKSSFSLSTGSTLHSLLFKTAASPNTVAIKLLPAQALPSPPPEGIGAFAIQEPLVYQKSVDFADVICSVTEPFQRGYGFLVGQLNRAALSMAANFAEGNGGFTKADSKNFFGIARGSGQECLPQLELARRRGLIDESKRAELESQLEEISRMLPALINGLENRET